MTKYVEFWNCLLTLGQTRGSQLSGGIIDFCQSIGPNSSPTPVSRSCHVTRHLQSHYQTFHSDLSDDAMSEGAASDSLPCRFCGIIVSRHKLLLHEVQHVLTSMVCPVDETMSIS